MEACLYRGEKSKKKQKKSVYADLPIPKQRNQNLQEDWVDRLIIGKNSVRLKFQINS